MSPINSKDKQMGVILALLGLVVLLFGFFHLKGLIKKPFGAQNIPQTSPSAELLRLQEQAQAALGLEGANLEELKNKDTDQDGLSDYVELQVYNTSPYLADSDSDGYNDKEEIDSGHNPNCPADKDCGPMAKISESTEVSGTEPDASSLLPSFGGLSTTPELLSNPGGSSASSLFPSGLSAENIRSLLLQAGMPKETLDQFNDETLMQVYEETLKEAEGQRTAP